MIQPDILIKSKRKSLSLTINDEGKLIVHAPQKMAFEQIFAFLEKKQGWIREKQNKAKEVYQINKKIMRYEQILFLGKMYNVVRVQGIKDVFLEGAALCVPAHIRPEKLQNELKKWFLLLAEEVILDRLDYFAELMDLDFTSVKFVNSRAKWGSCDSKYNLAFNLKLMMLPPQVIDYVIIHELAHILQLNHSAQFWEVVASMIPAYKKHRETLKNSGFLLNLFVVNEKES